MSLYRDMHHSKSPHNPFSTHSLPLLLEDLGGHGNVGYGEDSRGGLRSCSGPEGDPAGGNPNGQGARKEPEVRG